MPSSTRGFPANSEINREKESSTRVFISVVSCHDVFLGRGGVFIYLFISIENDLESRAKHAIMLRPLFGWQEKKDYIFLLFPLHFLARQKANLPPGPTSNITKAEP